MVQYYVRKTGSDSNNGTSAATAWLTLRKVFGHSVSSPVVGGDIVYIGGGGTYRETVIISTGNAANFPQPASVVQIIGDVDGSHTGDAGEVIFSQFTTNDTTAAAGASIIDFNSRGNLTFDSISFVAGSSSPPFNSSGAVANCANVTFKRCFGFSLSTSILTLTCVTDTNMNWLFEKCILYGTAGLLSLTNPTSTVADYTIGFTLRNCLAIMPNAVNTLLLTGSGAGSFKPGGASVYDCTFLGGSSIVRTATAGGFSTTIPVTVYNSDFFSGPSTVCVNAATSGQMLEDFNYFTSGSPRTNVTAGTNSKVGNVLYPGIHMGQEYLYGFIGRPFAMPTIASPLLGFGKSGSVTSPTDDLLGRARPEGGGSTSNAIGAFERHDTATLDASPPAGRTSKAYLLTGPGSHEVVIPVDTTSSTISIYVQYDANYTGTNYPQVMLVNGEQAGVTAQTVTATSSASGAWLQLTFSAFTATAKGEVTLRLVSQSGGATGKCWFADYAIV